MPGVSLKRPWRSIHAAALGAAVALLAGCALLGSHAIAPPAPAPVAPAAPPAPLLLAPIDTHHFTLSGNQDDVVGEVQITLASKDDTLPDIARRFDVGYEEIVRANPGVEGVCHLNR